MNTIRLYRTACGYISSSASGARFSAAVLQQSRRINKFGMTGLHVLTRTVVEQVASDGTQPELERLLAAVTSPERPYDMLVVSSTSKLSRWEAKLEEIGTRLLVANVKIVVLDEVPAAGSAPMMAEAL